MTDKQRIAELVQRHGIDGLTCLLADYTEEQAEEHEDTPTGETYDRAARMLRRTGREVHEMLARK